MGRDRQGGVKLSQVRVALWLNALALAVLLLPVGVCSSSRPPRATEAAIVLLRRGAILLNAYSCVRRYTMSVTKRWKESFSTNCL
jgi:hypothetical protein